MQCPGAGGRRPALNPTSNLDMVNAYNAQQTITTSSQVYKGNVKEKDSMGIAR